MANPASQPVVASLEDVNCPWAICIAREDASSLAGLRLFPGLELAESGPDVWLRGPAADQALTARLSALPARARYEFLSSNQVRQLGQRVPARRLPDLPWQRLDAWLRVEVPPAALPAIQPGRVPLTLVRSVAEHEPDFLLTELERLKEFACQAAQLRLERLQFAAKEDGLVLVRGTPLPPVPGRKFVAHGSVAVPAGWSWDPPVGVEVLERLLGASGDALVVWNDDESFTRLHSEQFVSVTRSSVLETARAQAG